MSETKKNLWGEPTEPLVTVEFAHNGKAIVVSDEGEYFYVEMPMEFVMPGTVLQKQFVHPVSELPEKEQQDIELIVSRLPAEEPVDLEDLHDEEL